MEGGKERMEKEWDENEEQSEAGSIISSSGTTCAG